MRRVGTDLSRHAEKIRALATEGLPILAVGAGAELFSRGVSTLDGNSFSGIDVFPFRVIRTTERRVGYVVARGDLGDLIGFEDHASTWVLDDDAVAYSRVISGGGSIAAGNDNVTEAPGESVRVNNSFATNVQGPVLPLNPWLSDLLIRAAAERASLKYELSEGHRKLDVLAEGARETIIRIIDDKRFSYIGV
jgi:CobQ-like glutamine amidotransferase family enzyme